MALPGPDASYARVPGHTSCRSRASPVGSDGDAFGVANNTTMTVMDLLKATDLQSASGVLYGGNATKRSHANDVFGAINQAGGI
jgi:hypothetical protein